MRIESGVAVWMDPVALQAAVREPDTRAGVWAVAPGALRDEVAAAAWPLSLNPVNGAATDSADAVPTLGVWG